MQNLNTGVYTKYSIDSKQLQLLRCIRRLCLFPPTEKLHHSELLIGNCENNYLTVRRKKTLYSFYMNIGIFS